MTTIDRAAERRLDLDAEALAARLTRAAYDVALRHGISLIAFRPFRMINASSLPGARRSEGERG